MIGLFIAPPIKVSRSTFLRQVDDFALGCPNEELAKEIYGIIGAAIKFPSEERPPFQYLGLLNDFNGVKVEQASTNISLSAEDYIQRVLATHGWTTPSSKLTPLSKSSPFGADLLPRLYKDEGACEETPEHKALENQKGFKYRSLLGELMYAYVTCRPDIGYHVTTLSKFSLRPAAIHYDALKNVVRYLRATANWAIIFSRAHINHLLIRSEYEPIPAPEGLPEFPLPDDPLQLVGFVDAASANDLRKRRSTTGYAFILSNGVISYRSKTQSITATSSTEAEFLAAVVAAKQAKYLRAIMTDLGFVPDGPTLLYIDNESVINMINHRVPTECSRHIDIQHFAIQDWCEQGDITTRHISGIINPSDDLTKPLGWVLHACHACRIMGHYSPDAK